MNAIPVTILAIEQAITQRLKARITTLTVASFPDDPEQWEMRDRRGYCLIAWRGDSFGDIKSVDLVYQERRLEFDIHILMRKLRGHEGAYLTVEAVRLALTGFEIPGCTKLAPVRTKFLGTRRREGVWTYALTFATTAPAFEAPEVEILPLLTRIALLDEDGNADGVVPASYL